MMKAYNILTEKNGIIGMHRSLLSPVLEYKAVTKNGTIYWIEFDRNLFTPTTEIRVKNPNKL